MSSRVNDCMTDLLAPLLPLARLLKVSVLDFDVYLESQDSDKTNADLIPLIEEFLEPLRC
eukprot:scaffold1446_cov391-Prasinococcus_capsulatus_cf.AAC.21